MTTKPRTSTRRLVAAGLSAAALGAFLAPVQQAAASAAPAPRVARPVHAPTSFHEWRGDAPVDAVGPAQTVVAPGQRVTVQGTVTRAELGERAGREFTATYLAVTGTGLVRLTGTRAEALTAGSEVRLSVGAAARADAVEVLEVLRTATTRSTAQAAATVHHVTVALVAPKGFAPGDTTEAQVRAGVQKAAEHWSAQTGGRISFVVDRVAPWRQSATQTCSTMQGLWNEAAAATGFDFAPASHLLVVVPKAAYAAGACGLGLGTIGSPTAAGAVTVADTGQSAIAHELGHNLGMGHSNYVSGAAGCSCGAVHDGTRWVSPAAYTEYGDLFDVMGYSDPDDRLGVGSLNAVRRDQLGLFPAEVATVSASTEVDLQALAATTAGTKVLKLTTGTDTYYVEHRADTGADARALRAGFGLQPGLRVLHRDFTPGADGLTTTVLDASPTAQSGTGRDLDTAVTVGRTFSVTKGLHVTLLSAAGGVARVKVTFGPLAPAPVTPPAPAPAPVVGTPKAPALTGSGVANGAAWVTWNPAATQDGGSPVTGYVATAYQGGTARATAKVAAGTGKVTFTGLRNGTAHTIGLRAVSKVGQGAETLSPVLTPLTVPAAVTGGRAALTRQTAVLTWAAPSADGGSPVSRYVVTTTRNGVAAGTVDVPAPSTTLTRQLDPGATYAFDVAAVTAAGTGKAVRLTVKVPPLAAPGTPAGVRVTAAGTRATVSWSAPTTDGGTDLTGYAVSTYRNGVLTGSSPVGAASTSTTAEIPAGAGWSFTVAAVNAVGTGKPTPRSAVVRAS